METEHKVGPLAFHLQAYNNEAQILERLVYRNLNQHRRTRVFQLIKKISKLFASIPSKKLESVYTVASKTLRTIQNPKVSSRDIEVAMESTWCLQMVLNTSLKALDLLERLGKEIKRNLSQLLFVPLYTMLLALTARTLKSLASVTFKLEVQSGALLESFQHLSVTHQKHELQLRNSDLYQRITSWKANGIGNYGDLLSRLRKVYVSNSSSSLSSSSSSSSSSKKGNDAETAVVPSGPGSLLSSGLSTAGNSITTVSNAAEATTMNTNTSCSQGTSVASKVHPRGKAANKGDNEDFGEILVDGDDGVNAVAAVGGATDANTDNYLSVRSSQSFPPNDDDSDGSDEETFISLNRGEEKEGEEEHVDGEDVNPGDADVLDNDKMKEDDDISHSNRDDGEDITDDSISWFVDVPGVSASVVRLQDKASEAEGPEQLSATAAITESSTGNRSHGGDDAKEKPQKRKRQLSDDSDPESIGAEENILRQMKKKPTRREGKGTNPSLLPLDEKASLQPPLNFDSVLGHASSTVTSITKREGGVSIGGKDGSVKAKTKKPKKKTKSNHDDIDDIFGGL